MLFSALTLAIMAAGAQAQESNPYFFFSSTQHLSLQSLAASPPVSDVHNVMWAGLSTCPTKHYAVVVQPGASTQDYADTWLPVGAGTKTAVITSDVQGKVNINHVLNTILMDCLHYGVLRVEEVDTTQRRPPHIESNVVRESIIYAVMPDVGKLRGQARVQEMKKHDEFVYAMIADYFQNKDYTMIYVGEPGEQDVSKDVLEEQQNTGAEKPLMLDE